MCIRDRYLYIAPVAPEPDTGDLSLTKEVSGEGADTEREFSFTVTLSDDTISGVYGDMVFDDGVATVKAKHGQTVNAIDLPAGVTYKIVEIEANQDGYATSSTGETGAILKDEVAEAVFVNHKEKTVEVLVEKIWKLNEMCIRDRTRGLSRAVCAPVTSGSLPGWPCPGQRYPC